MKEPWLEQYELTMLGAATPGSLGACEVTLWRIWQVGMFLVGVVLGRLL